MKSLKKRVVRSLVERFRVAIDAGGRTFVLHDDATGFKYEFGIHNAEESQCRGRLMFNIDYPEGTPIPEQSKKAIPVKSMVFAARR